MQNASIYKALKYVALTASIYLIFRVLPNNDNYKNFDVLIVTAILVLVYILYDNLFVENYSCAMPPVCNNACSVKPEKIENMEVVTKEEKKNEPVEVKKEITVSFPKITDTQLNKPDSERGIDRGETRATAGTLDNDMKYTDYNHIPMADNYDKSDFEYGDSMLPPEKWYPQPPHPPVCVAEKECPVCPIYTIGAPVNVKEWNSSRRVTPPMNVNTDYVKDKLNAGR